MKNKMFYAGMLAVFLYLMFSSFAYAVEGKSSSILPVTEKPVIKVIDSLILDLSKMDSTICIDGKVLLSFDNDTVFACEWIDMETGDTISKAKSVVVSPENTHQYRVNLYYFTGELIKNGDFEDERLPESRRVITDYIFGRTANAWGVLGPEGRYRIGKSPHLFHTNFYDIGDHTSGHGNMMVVNGSTSGNAVVWKQTVQVEKGRTYAFSTWGVEVGRNNPAQFHFTINGKTLGKDFQLIDYGREHAKWDQFYELWTADASTAVISLVNLNVEPDGNDFAIDDISFASMEKKTGVITIKVLPSVKLGQLPDVKVCEDEKISVIAQAEGTGISGYKWEKNDRELTFSGSLLEFDRAKIEDAGEYTCSVSGECGTRVERFQIDVREKLRVGKLVDTIFPCEEEAVILVTDVTGYFPKFTWTAPEKSAGWLGSGNKYVNSKIYWSRDTGTYICRVTSECGDTTAYHRLEAGEKLQITDIQEDQVVCAGSKVPLFVKTNQEPRQVTWTYPDKTTHSGKMDFVVSDVTEKDMGIYHCVLQGNCGEVVTGDVIVRLESLPDGLKISKDTAVCEGEKVVFEASANGKGLSYFWTGPNGYEAVASSIVLGSVTSEQAGVYKVVVKDSCGNRLFGEVSLQVVNEFEQIGVTEQVEICPGEGARLEVPGGGTDMEYRWTSPGGKNYNGAVLNLKAAEEGTYVCRMKGKCGVVEKQVPVRFKTTLKVTGGKDHFRVCPEENVVLQAEAGGEEITAVWMKDDRFLGNGLKLELNSVKDRDAGIYQCRIKSACGDTVLQYVLELKEPLQVVNHIGEKYVRPGEAVSLFVNVEGDSERFYEWRAGGKILEGENSNYLHFTAPERDTLLVYAFQATGCNVEKVEIPVYVRDYQNLERDTIVFLCEGSDWSCKAIEKPEDWCTQGRIRQYWVYKGKDTVSYGSALTFLNYGDLMEGEYVYTLESECGKETLRLQVGTMRQTAILSLHGNVGTGSDGDMAICEGEEVFLTAEVETGSLVTYEWSKDGEILKGATTARLALGKVSTFMAGYYECRVISADCGEDTKGINVKVYRKPNLTYESLVEKCPGEGVTLKVRTDAVPLSDFVWSGPARNRWAAENNGYSATYKNAAVSPEDEGVYQCLVKGVCGVDTARIRLEVEKEITLSPVTGRDTVCPGSSVKLQLPVPEEGIKCTWVLPNHTLVEGNSVEVNYFSALDEGTYHYILKTKRECFTREGDIQLSMRDNLLELVISPDTAVCDGQSVRFRAYAEGKEVRYEWWGPDGIKGEGPEVVIASVTENNVGVYEVVAIDGCHTEKRAKVRLSLKKEFEALEISKDTVVCMGEDALLKVEGGSGNLKYEWLLKDKAVGQGAKLEVRQAGREQSGAYICRVSGECRTVEKKVSLQVYDVLVARKPDIAPVCEREDIILVAEAEGERIGYKWRKGEEEVGYRSNQLELKDVIPSDAGRYECNVTSLCGDTTLVYDFQLKEKTRILRHSADRVLCEDDDYVLMAEAMGENNRYTWSCDGRILPETGNVLECPAVGHADTLVYTCVVEGDCGKDSMYVVIKVGEFRKVRGNKNDSLCEGSNYKYNVDVIPSGAFEGMGFQYRWTFNGKLLYEGTNSVFSLTGVKPEDAGDYFCEITTLSDLMEPKSATVKLHIDVVRLPRVVSITEDIYAIEGSSTSVAVVADGDELTYLWSKDGVETGHSGKEWSFQPVAYEDRGVYQVMVSNQCGHATGMTEVEIWRKTVIVYPQERFDSVCRGSDIALEVVAWGEVGLLYKWYLDGTLVDAPFTQPLQLDSTEVDMAGTYVCVVGGRGGVDSCKIHLKVMELPEVGITGTFQLCREESDLIQTYTGNSSEGRVDYEWSVAGGQMISAVNWDNTTVKWSTEEENTLTLTLISLSTGCRASRTETVVYFPEVEAGLMVPDEVGYCRDSLSLTRAYPWGGDFYVNGEKTNVVYFKEKDREYKIGYYYIDENTGCHSQAYDTVKIAQQPRLHMKRDTVTSGWCMPVTLEVGDRSAGDITWGGEQGLETVREEQAVFKAGSYLEKPVKFWAVLTDSYGCEAADSTVIVLLDSPKVELMKDTVIGVCSELVLRGNYEAEEPVKVSWEPSDYLEVTDNYTARLLNNKIGTALYQLSVTDRYGCVGKDEVEVTVLDAPSLVDKAVCEGDSLVINMGPYAEWTWKDGFTETVRVLRRPGSYEVVVKDIYGCEGEAWYEVHPLPQLCLADTMIFEGEKMEFVAEGRGDYGPYTFEWQDGSRGMMYTTDKEGYYSVKITDNLGCFVRDTAFLEVRERAIAAPDAFLPNSSGENSRFYLKEVNFASTFEMYIYDRWGELLYKTDEIGFNGGWNGMFKGMHCQPGAYVWVAFVDGKEIGRGTLMLVK